MTDLGPYIGQISKALLGEPNKRLSSAKEYRFGNNGSLSIDLERGRWFDHEMETGGNVVELLARQGVTDVADWLEQNIGLGKDPKPRNGNAPDDDAKRVLEATYDYTDEAGDMIFQALRFRFETRDGVPLTKDGKVKKTFMQRRKAKPGEDSRDGWIWSVKGVRMVPYRLPDLLEALANDHRVFVVEGEKKADRLWSMGVPSTCNPMGAGKWPDALTPVFAGASVIILPDNDDAGQAHAELVHSKLLGTAASVKVLDLPKLPPKGDILDWHGSVEELNTLADTLARDPADKPLKFGAVWFGEADRILPDPEYLVEGMLTRGDMSLCYGASKSGKSFFASDCALAIARGVPFFERETIRGGVAYVAGEGRKGFKKRLRAYAIDRGLQIDENLPFVLIPSALDLFGKDTNGGDLPVLQEELVRIGAAMKALGIALELIVIDTFASVSLGANENASEDMSRLIKNFQAIQIATGAHVMIVHHVNAMGFKPRGHTSLFAGIDNAIEVQCDQHKNRTAIIQKLKDGLDGISLFFKLKPVDIGTLGNGKPDTSCVVEPQAAPERASTKGPQLSPQTRLALKALEKVMLESGQAAPTVLNLGASGRVCRVSEWVAAFEAMSFDGEGANANPDTVRKALQRAGTALINKGLIGRQGPLVWLIR